ncbi:general substrate transporter [Cadophora sp. DSE1049]|nr:general substrate transporter [Cadophora sp. DSE1049]
MEEDHEKTGGIDAVAHLASHEDHQQTRMQAIKQNPWAFAWCMYAVWMTIVVSFENQASGIVIGIPQFRKDFGYLVEGGTYVIPAQWQAAFSAGPVASTAIGALTAGFFADLLGRKKTVMAFLAVSFGSITMEFVSTTNALFFAGKFVNGLAVGVLAAICPTYVGEISPLAIRGLLTCLIALAYTIGPLTASLILNSTGTMETRWAYRAVFCAQYGFAGIAALFVVFMPESPWWLCSRGEDQKALRSLARLGYTENGEGEKRLAVIKFTLEQVKRETEGATYLECFRKSNLRRTIISIAPLSIQALGGVIFIAGYSTYYFQLAGFSTAFSFQLFVVLQVVSMVGNICSWFVIDRVGRRNLTLWGVAVLTIILMLAGGLATVGTVPALKGCIAFMVVYGFFYNISIGSTAYTILTENATSRLRIKTIAIGIAVQNSWYTMWNLVLPYLFNPDKANLGAKISFIFGGMSVLSCIYVYFYQPETTGRSYEELDEMYMKHVPARAFRTFVTEAQRQGQEASKDEE